MSSNNIFHKQNKRSTESLARHPRKRKPYQKVLIVCEGQVTEPNYFNELIRHHRISSANVAITGAGGSSPQSVVELAKNRYARERKLGDPFDNVFCVFDKDSHSSYDDALRIIQHIKPDNTFAAITSVPAFEYWFLLHYEYNTRPDSSAQVLAALKTYFPDYGKNRAGVFIALLEKLETAKQNARQALREANKTGTDNPSTKVHELVEFLQQIKS